MATDKDGAAWRAIPMIVENFNFSESEILILLGQIQINSYHEGLESLQRPLDSERLHRVSYLLGIMKALRKIFPNEARAFGWIDRENALKPFNGMTPRQFMLQGSIEHLQQTRRFLDSWTV